MLSITSRLANLNPSKSLTRIPIFNSQTPIRQFRSQLRTPQDNKSTKILPNNNQRKKKEIVLFDSSPPPLSDLEKTSSADGAAKIGEFPLSGFFKRLPKRVLAVLSNLPLAIGEMFTIAALMALGMFVLPKMPAF